MDTKRLFIIAGLLLSLCASAEVDWTANPVVIDEGTEANPVEVDSNKDIIDVKIGNQASGFVEILNGGGLTTPEKSGGLVLGDAAGANGTLKVDQGGMCSIYSIKIGVGGMGNVSVCGGAVSVTRTTEIGVNEGSYGEVFISQNGTLSSGTKQASIGVSGTGVIHIVTGTFSHSPVKLGENEAGHGSIWIMRDGVLSSQNNSVSVGCNGSGIVYMRGGTWTKTGTAVAKLCVRETAAAYGAIIGWGEITMGKKYTLDNNGLVIADGRDDNGMVEERTLSYTASGELTAYTNSIENASTNGWYAINKGHLSMSVTTSISAGDSGVLTWGEAEDDDVIDLVNSARVTFYNITDETAKKKGIYAFTGNLYAADRSDVPALPGGVEAVGVWKFEISGQYETADVEFRYDHMKAPKGVKIYQLGADGETWTKLETAGLDGYRAKVSGVAQADASRMFAAVAASSSGTIVIIR